MREFVFKWTIIMPNLKSTPASLPPHCTYPFPIFLELYTAQLVYPPRPVPFEGQSVLDLDNFASGIEFLCPKRAQRAEGIFTDVFFTRCGKEVGLQLIAIFLVLLHISGRG